MEVKKVIMPNAIMLGEVKRLLAEGREVVIMTKGVSMLPFIVGSRDSVLLYKKDDLKVGDIALAEVRPGHYVLHRVIEVLPERVTLKGDGNIRGTEVVVPSNVVGAVKEIQRGNGRIVDPWEPKWQRRWHIWIKIPTIVRRVLLKIRRTFLKTI